MPKQTKADRARHIKEKIQSGIRALLASPQYNWNLENETIYEAAVALGQAEIDFTDGKGSEDEVRTKYKAYVALHLVEPA